MSERTEPLEPPGSYGLPIFGVLFDTVDFLFVSGWQRFFQRRRAKYRSSVFKTSLFQKTIVLTDHEAISNLFASTPLVQDHGFSWAVPPLPLVGNSTPSIFKTGYAHDQPKNFYLKLIERRSSKLPSIFENLFERYAERWNECGTFDWREELERFTVDLVFQWLLDLKVDADKVRTIYNNIFTDIFWRITRLFPWSAYSKSLRYYRELIQSIENSVDFQSLSEMALECGLRDQSYIAKQLAFLIGMNSYLGLQCLFKSIVGELSIRPDVSRGLLEHVGKAKPGQIWEGSLAAVDLFIMEVLRLHPPVFFVFGRATKDTTIGSASGVFRIAVGELLMGVIPEAHSNDAIFTNASMFDPDRFRSPDQRQHLIWPRGLHDDIVRSNDRTCPGKDVALAIARGFCVALLTKAAWKMTAPVSWDKHWFNLNVAAPKGDLPVRFTLRVQH
jgi:cytochrome P450